MSTLIEVAYLILSLWLALYGLNSLYLLRKRRSAAKPPVVSPPDDWPAVTVQLPVYNELSTVSRLIDAAARLDYPGDRLQIQILDDSSDGTSGLIQRKVAQWEQSSLNIVHLQRSTRRGYKAGALAEGLKTASGDLIAIFDADFIPPPEFLRQTVPYFSDPELACVQARWDHLNRTYSLFTRLQAMGIDGHFAIEQTARSGNGLWLNFNGTAGLWRKAAIHDSGGWQTDTITEDLDLSYRAQMAGWKIQYLPNISVPAELPAQVAAYKQQQARWAQGSLQTARKLLPCLWRSRASLKLKILGSLHLTGYLVHPLILTVMLLAVPIRFIDLAILRWSPLLLLAAIGPPLMYLNARVPGGPGFRRRLRLMPALVLLGLGLTVNNSLAAIKGLFGWGRHRFLRTPKFGLYKRHHRWEHNRYALMKDGTYKMELLLAAASLASLALAEPEDLFGFTAWRILFALSFGYVGLLSWIQSRRRQRAWGSRRTTPAKSAAENIPNAA
jgi:cellulose synthase/poly-beta-1,6-N-acetylglucosamine synthase-like glycosyltransferase